MEISRFSYVLSIRLCPYVSSVRNVVWEMRGSKRLCKARLEVDDYFLHSGYFVERGEPTIASETWDTLSMLQISDIWTTLSEVIKKFRFVASFVYKKGAQKWLWLDENGKERWRIPSEVAYKWVTASTSQKKCQRFLRFRLRYTALNWTISRVFWQSMQRCLNLVPSRWKSLWRAGNDSHERVSDQSWR